MKSTEAINKIKIMLGLEKEKFEKTATLADGTEVRVEDEFEVGAQLSVITEDGLIPAPEGSHTTEEGVVVTVDAAGVITDIVAAEEMKDEDKEEMKDEEDKEEMYHDKEEMTEAVVAAIVEAIAPIVAEMEKVKEEMKKMKGDFSKFSAEPGANPIRNNFSQASKTDSRIAALKRMKTNN